jgi:hypothetical protein
MASALRVRFPLRALLLVLTSLPNWSVMKCPVCNNETKHNGTCITLVGYDSPEGHNHDDNCKTREYQCTNVKCKHFWKESKRNKCSIPGCDWIGKESCFCHYNPKVTEWSDPEDYYSLSIKSIID